MDKSKRFAVALDTFNILESDKALAALAEKYKPKEGINYVGFTFHATVPEINMKAMALTPQTTFASLDSAVDMMVDFEHIAEDIPIPREEGEEGKTEVVGHIVELAMDDIPNPDNEEAWLYPPYIPKKALMTCGVMALYTRITKVRSIANEVGSGAPWYFSLEIGENCPEPAIWLKGTDEKPHSMIGWGDASEELRGLASQPRMMEYEGQTIAYLMGGLQGKIPFIGGAITRNPAGFEQRQPGRSLMLIASADGAITDMGGSIKDLQTLTNDRREEFKTRLKKRKEGGKTSDDDGGIIAPIVVETMEGAIDVYKTIASIDMDNSTGGDKAVAKVELEQEELDKRIADAEVKAKADGKTEGDAEGYERGKVDGVAEAVEARTHIPVDQLGEAPEVEAIVEKRTMAKAREASIAALPCDDETKADFMAIATNESRYPLDADGQTKFAESVKRWEASMKTASTEDDNKGKGEEDKDKKLASLTEQGKDFDPGSGGGTELDVFAQLPRMNT
jgi:hypothetical protein